MVTKKSLNDLVRSGFDNWVGLNFEVEFDLAEDMPKTYTPDQGYVLYSLQKAIGTYLNQEFLTHGQGNKRITTQRTADQQVIYLDHCGEHIQKIDFLNETLRLITQEGQDEDGGRFRPSGNNMAARSLIEYRGTMRYENINDGQYKVRCAVLLPLDSS